jgi:PAS domain S-box-containing protein
MSEPATFLDSLRTKLGELAALASDRADPGGQVSALVGELESALVDLDRRVDDARARYATTLWAERSKYRDLFQLAPEAYVVTDAAGMIRDANGEAATLLGRRRSLLVDKPLVAFVAAEDRSRFRSWLSTLRATRFSELEVRICPRGREDPIESVFRVATSTGRSGQEPRLRWLIRDVTERRRMESAIQRSNAELEARVRDRTRELEEANREKNELLVREREARELAERLLAEARDADRRKNDFLAMLGHELRNPLAPIVSSLRILETIEIDGASEGARHALRQARSIAQRQATNLVRIVDDLLEVSRIERGAVALEIRPLDLAGPIASAVDATRERMDERRQQRSVLLPAEPLWVDGDPTRLEQVLVNLLDNATKYTPIGGKIELRAEREGDDAVLRVRDDGFGIGDDILPHLFEPFTQAKQSLARSAGGLGLGLAVTRRLVEMHRGSIGATTFGPNRGSEFVVRLPLRAAPDRSSAASLPTIAASHPRHRALVVDDNADAADSLAEVLRMFGYDATVVYDGKSVLAEVGRAAPDAVLLDIGLPEMDGYEVARQLRDREGERRTLLVAITGYGGSRDRRVAKEAGFDVFLTKPVDPEALRRLLEERLPSNIRA